MGARGFLCSCALRMSIPKTKPVGAAAAAPLETTSKKVVSLMIRFCLHPTPKAGDLKGQHPSTVVAPRKNSMSEPLTTSAEGLVLSTKALLSLGARRITVVINTMVTAMLFLQMKETTASVLGRVLER